MTTAKGAIRRILTAFALGAAMAQGWALTYDPNWTKAQCDTYSFHGLYERYVLTSNIKGWIDNDVWDSSSTECVDCSAYVERCLALPGYRGEHEAGRSYTTANFYPGVPNTVQITQSALQQWDLWVYTTAGGAADGNHTGLCKSTDASYVYTREARGAAFGVVEYRRTKQRLTDQNSRYYRRASWGVPPSTRVPAWKADFDGDGKADAAVWRPSNGTWYISGTQAGYWEVSSFGFSTDIPVPADYDGDGKHDAAIWRPSNGYWYIRGTTAGYWEKPAFGYPSDIPVPSDYDGDDKADAAVWRPSNGTWYISGTLAGSWSVQYGVSGDIPLPADYDGDGKTDAAVFRPSNGNWYISGSTLGSWTVAAFGYATDIPVPSDYDGDGKADAAIWRPSNGYWYIRGTLAGYWEVPSYGYSSDIPVPAKYDADGKADAAVWRPSNGTWYIRGSAGTSWNLPFGLSGDVPL